MKNCDFCKHRRELLIAGESKGICCTGAPPTAMMQVGAGGAQTFFAMYPLIPHVRCGQYKRSFWRWLTRRP